jgi:uncharacterized protein (TIGR03546 family)
MAAHFGGWLASVCRFLIGGSGPWQTGSGAVCGMCIGLLPKDLIWAYLAGLLALVMGANLLCCLASAALFTVVGLFCGQLLHKLGAVVLTHPSLVSFWGDLYHTPFVPWTRFNNTVVMGGLFISLLLAYPVFQLASRLGRKPARGDADGRMSSPAPDRPAGGPSIAVEVP